MLLAFGVTMLRRETALEFPGIEHGQALHEFQASRAGKTAPPVPAAAATTIGGSGQAEPAPAGGIGRVETLERLAALRDRGAITTDEYQAEKAHVMSNGA